MVKRGLFIGRFNPPHLGHIKTVESILKNFEIDQLIIGIGSAQESYTLNNPFTSGERYEMISIGLEDISTENRKKIIIIPLQDINNNSQWISYIKSLLPKFEVIFSNNPLVKLLTLKDSNLQAQEISFINRKEFSSTNIRNKMIDNDNSWEGAVSELIKKYIFQIDGVQRLRILASEDID